eukprot:2242754-Pleurochrysis_carterae.AAC.1
MMMGRIRGELMIAGIENGLPWVVTFPSESYSGTVFPVQLTNTSTNCITARRVMDRLHMRAPSSKTTLFLLSLFALAFPSVSTGGGACCTPWATGTPTGTMAIML